jgi:hypothetical protein
MAFLRLFRVFWNTEEAKSVATPPLFVDVDHGTRFEELTRRVADLMITDQSLALRAE